MSAEPTTEAISRRSTATFFKELKPVWRFANGDDSSWQWFEPGTELTDTVFHKLNLFQIALAAATSPPAGLRWDDHGITEGKVEYDSAKGQLTLQDLKLRTDKGFYVHLPGTRQFFKIAEDDLILTFGFTKQFVPTFHFPAGKPATPSELSQLGNGAMSANIVVDIGALRISRAANGTCWPAIADARWCGQADLDKIGATLKHLLQVVEVLPVSRLEKAGAPALDQLVKRRLQRLDALVSGNKRANPLSMARLLKEGAELVDYLPGGGGAVGVGESRARSDLDKLRENLDGQFNRYVNLQTLIGKLQEKVNEWAGLKDKDWLAAIEFQHEEPGQPHTRIPSDSTVNEFLCAYRPGVTDPKKLYENVDPPGNTLKDIACDVPNWFVYWKKAEIKSVTFLGTALLFRVNNLPPKLQDGQVGQTLN